MKGLTHFISGVAFGTFFPAAVAAAAETKSFILVLGGIGGILPDTLDFKLARFLEEFDIEVDPDHENTDPQKIADAVAESINRAGRQNRTIKIMLHTVRLGADAWRKYSVLFNQEKQQVEVTIGPVVSTSRIPYIPSEPPDDRKFAVAKVDYPFVHTYDRANDVTIFSGPDFDMKPRNGRVEIEFLSWHRRWSHSLTLAALLGVIGWLGALVLHKLAGVSLAVDAWMYGLVLGGGAAVHVLEDQTGFMGSNLFYPFTKERTSGLRMFHSGHPMCNFTTVYLAVMIILFNLNRYTPPKPVWTLSPLKYWGFFFLLPMAVLYTVAFAWSDKKKEKKHDFGDKQDIVDEADEEGIGA